MGELLAASRVAGSEPPELLSITYMSTAVRLLTRGELEHLVARAGLRNQACGVTGVLLYDEGSFIQCIEGSRGAVDLVYACILADTRHHNFFEILRDPIEQREFPEWSMGLCTRSGPAALVDDLLMRRVRSASGTLSASRHLLSAFWSRARPLPGSFCP